MITIFELKHHRCCGCIVNLPFYIKNFFLLTIMSAILLIIYIIYFRSDGKTFQNIPRILKGLNSNTFNYLLTHKDNLHLSSTLNEYPSFMTSISFMEECVRINRPCKFENLSSDWPLKKKWNF